MPKPQKAAFDVWFIRFTRAAALLILPFFAALVIQCAPRLYLLLKHATTDLLAGYMGDLFKMFYIGLRFDIRTAVYACSFFLILAGFLAVRHKSFGVFTAAYPYIAVFTSLIFTFSSIVAIFYFNTYNRSIDVFIFGLVDDDTSAIIKTIWHEYPIIKIAVFSTALAFAFYKLYKFWADKCAKFSFNPSSIKVKAAFLIILAGLIFVGSRGSAGLFPLRQNNAQVSDLALLNALTPNAFMAFDWALKHYKSYKRNFGITQDWGEIGGVINEFFGEEKPPELSIFETVSRSFPPIVEEKPHVVLLVMESMGTHLLNFDDKERDLLGELRSHWQEDYLFRLFTAEGSGTLDSLTRLLLLSPTDSISQSPLQGYDFTSNMLKPYIKSGYKVVFVTSGSGSWRNLNNFLPKQGVNEFVEQSTLQKLFPEAQLSAWGVPDEYMLRYIKERLIKADEVGERLLILALSTTFHPPYIYPKSFTPSPIKISKAELKRLSNLADGEKGVVNVFNTLKYVNNSLGVFLTDIKQSALRGRIVIAVTGDHNIRGVGYPDPTETVLGWAVPFYLYIPTEYRRYAAFDPLTPASHKDIWPTLYNTSLPNTYYYSLGCDLLAEDKDSPFCFGYYPGVVFDKVGAYAYRIGEFREWADELNLAPPKELAEDKLKVYKRYQLIEKLIAWQLSMQAGGAEQR